MKRHSALSCVIGLGFLAVAGACATSSQDNQHGPSFDDDGGGSDGPQPDAPNDAHGSDAADAGHDATPDVAMNETGGDDSSADDSPSDVVAQDSPADVIAMDAPPDVADASNCTALTAVVAGNTGAFGAAISVGGGAWTTYTFAGGVAKAPALVTSGSGFHSVVVRGDGTLAYTTYGSSWSTPAALATVQSLDAVALAPVGADVHLVYRAQSTDSNINKHFFHGTYHSGAWDAATDPVGMPASFGESGPSAASLGTTFTIAQAGEDTFLYDQTWSTSWQLANKHGDAVTQNTIAPTIIPMSGGADLMIVYVRPNDVHLMYTTRAAGVWSTAKELYNSGGNIALANTPVSLAPLANGHAALVFMGTDGKPYTSLYDPVSATPWSPPTQLVANAMVQSPPQVAPGVCGDDAIATYVLTSGDVEVVSLRGGTWGAPKSTGLTAQKYAAIATH